MAVGLLNKKVAFIIQARMKSTRLPGKILMPLPIIGGKPLLSYITDELKQSKFKNEIILATSINKENDVLVSFCDKQEIICYRGDEENVLSRFTNIAKNGVYDCVVRLTGDNPIIDITFLDNAIKTHFTNQNDYTSTENLPIGMNFEIISTKSLLNIENHVLTNSDKEHVTLFIRNNDKYKKEVFTCELPIEYRNLRLTVDYASDYSLLSILLSLGIQKNNLKGIALIEYAYNNYGYIFDINSSNIQKRQYSNIDEEIIEACKILDKFEYNRVSDILRNYKNFDKLE